MKTTNKRKILAIIGSLIIVMSVFASFAVTASAASWKTGNFDSGYVAKGYTTVRLSNLKKDAYIKIFTYSNLGWKTSGKIHVTLRDTRGKWICEFNTTSGTKLKLGKDHSAYRVYVAKQHLKKDADDFLNCGKCQMWAINAVSNCYM